MNMTKEDKMIYTDMLDNLVWRYEKEIANYAIESTEDLDDETFSCISRRITWSRGSKEHQIVVTPYGQIRYADRDVPRNLIIQMTNTTLETVYDLIGEP